MFAVIARLAMIFSSAVALPIAGWMLNRVITVVDRIGNETEQAHRDVLLVKQRLDFLADEQRDHEIRIRIIEARH
jgi:hypothetical protein